MPMKRVLVLDPLGANPSSAPVKTALAALVSRGTLDEVVDLPSLDHTIPGGAPFAAVLLAGRTPLALTQGLAAARVPHAMILSPPDCEAASAGRSSEAGLALAGQIAGVDALVAAHDGAARMLADHLGVAPPPRLLALDSILAPAGSDARPVTACVLITGEPAFAAALADIASKSGIKLHTLSGSTEAALAAAASFCTAYPNAILRILRAPRASLVAAAEEGLVLWGAAFRLMATAAWDIREMSHAEWSEQPRRLFARSPEGQRRFEPGRLVDDLASWLGAACAADRRITLAELRLLNGLVPRRAFGGTLRAPRPAPAFVVAPPQPPRPDALASDGGPGRLSLRALATPLPADARGQAWRDTLVAQAVEAERFLEERGLAVPTGVASLPPPAPEVELRIALSNLQADLRAADALLESRLAAMQSMENLIRERDATIVWQARTLDERWDAMTAMNEQIERLERRTSREDAEGETRREGRA